MRENIEFQSLKLAVEKICASGALGRSPTYAKLLEYLAEASESGVICSEVSLAIDVFNKGEDFDVTSDSTVRVYVHNLRQKLNNYYEQTGKEDSVRLSIPKGAYRLTIEHTSSGVKTEKTNHLPLTSGKSGFIYAALGFILALPIVYFASIKNHAEQHLVSEEQSLFWGGMLSDDKPIMIVIGDYYIFGENTQYGDIRLVREFDINSEADLRRAINQNQDDTADTSSRFDMGLSYLPRGSAYALSRIQENLARTHKKARVTVMSEFDAEDLRSNHIIYLGYLSGLSVLESYTFSASRFDIGFSYDELIDGSTQYRYTSDLIEAEEDRNFVDYGILSSYPNGEGHQIVVVAGTRDAGLMEMSDIAVAPSVLKYMGLDIENHGPLISLFEVYGFNLTNISSTLIGSEYIESDDIWGG